MRYSPGMNALLRRGRGWFEALPLQILFFILLPLSLLLLAVAFGGAALHQQAMRELVGTRDERAARSAAAAIGEQLNHRATAILTLAQQAASENDAEQILAGESPLFSLFDGGLALFSPAGTVEAATAGTTWATNFPAGILAPANAESVRFSLPFADPVSGEQLVAVAAPVGERLLAGAFSPAALSRRALTPVFGAGDQATAFLVDERGQLLYQLGSPLQPERNPAEHPGVISALRGESGTTYVPIAGDEHVVAFSPVAPVGWALVVEESWQAVADPLLHTTEWAPLVLAPLLLLTLMGLGLGVRQIVQPLQSLAEKATALAWGDFAAIETPVGGIVEIQRLQSELVHMAHKVRSAQQSLRGYLGAVTAGQEEERRRLARELHDDTIQSLIALNQRLQLAQLSPQNPATAEQLQEMQQMVSQLIADLRRQIHALRPIYLEDLGLVPALQMLCQEVQNAHPLAVNFHTKGTVQRLAPEVELALYRITQEALSNAARHAAATTATVTLVFATDNVRLTVRDDGRGFVPPESPAELAPQGHFGLLGIHERAELIGAHLILRSQPGEGTRLEVEVPTGCEKR